MEGGGEKWRGGGEVGRLKTFRTGGGGCQLASLHAM